MAPTFEDRFAVGATRRAATFPPAYGGRAGRGHGRRGHEAAQRHRHRSVPFFSAASTLELLLLLDQRPQLLQTLLDVALNLPDEICHVRDSE